MPPVASAATGATAHNVINAIISQHLARCYVYFGRAGARRIRAGWVRALHAAVVSGPLRKGALTNWEHFKEH